jgi:sugar O-acyltransferase (sialic acid O-acetyltransferase NeuD family)
VKKEHALIIVGDSAFAEVAYEYFTHDSPYHVVAFSVERPYLQKSELFGLPIVAFDEIEERYSPAEHSVFVATVYTNLNRLRARLLEAAKAKGYRPASYISSQAFVWRNVQIGEHCFIFENNVVQPFVKIGANVVLWSGNHIGHHSNIEDNVFVASHAVISGFVTIGANSFIGVNATVSNNTVINRDCVLGAGALAVKDVEENRVIRGLPGEASSNARRLYKVRTEDAE